MPEPAATLRIQVDGRALAVPPFTSVAAAIAIARPEAPSTRVSTTGERRFALCGMGVCQECRVTIDGRPHQLACQARCEDGMAIVSA